MMKRFGQWAATILTLCGLGQAQTIVQSAANGTNASSATVTITAPTPSHNLVAVVAYFGSDTLVVPTGWTVSAVSGTASCPQFTQSGQAICILNKTVAASPPTSYTFTQSGSDGISAVVYELSGVATNVLNAVGGGSCGSGPLVSPSATPTVTGTLPIVVYSPSTSTTPTAPSGWTMDSGSTASNYHSLFALHKNALTSDTTTAISASTVISPTVSFSACTTMLLAPGTVDPHPVAVTTGPYSCIANVPCAMNGSGSYDPNGLALTYAWSFGDGGTSTAINPTHTYTSTGSKSVTLTVTNTTPLSGSTPTTASVGPPVPTVLQVNQCAAVPNHSALTCTLTTQPNAGDLGGFVLPYHNNYVTFLPPDATWNCVYGGGASGSTSNPYYTVGICTHTFVPGDGLTYTFYPVGSYDTIPSGASLFEVYDALPPTIAFGLSSATTPALTPTVNGMLPVAGVFNTGGVPASGWTSMSAPTFLMAYGPLTTDTTTPISTTFTAGGYTNELAWTMLFPPGIPAAAPVASPAAGTYSTDQTVALSTSTPGGVIHYNLNSTVAASASDPIYTAPLPFTRTTLLSAITIAPGYANSGATAYNFVVHPGTIAGMSVGLLGNPNGYHPWLADLFHLDVSSAAVDPNSATMISFGSSAGHHNLFADGAMTYNIVDSHPGTSYATPLTPYGCTAAECYQFPQPPGVPDPISGEGDVAPYPIPANVGIEGNPPPGVITGDNHALILDRETQASYEFWHFTNAPATGGRPFQYIATSANIFSFINPDGTPAADTLQRPITFTSASAGGTDIFEGIAGFDDIAAAAACYQAGTCDGTLGHALRMTTDLVGCLSNTGSCYGYFQFPMTHSAPTGAQAVSATNLLYYGQRFRLKSSFALTGFSAPNQVTLRTLQKYGAIIDDLGQFLGINFTADPRFDIIDLQALNGIAGTNFEVLARSTIYNGTSYPSGPPHGTGTPPTINSFTATPAGSCSVLTLSTTGASYAFIDKAGLYRGPVTVCPSVTTTYTATAQGPYLTNVVDGTGDGDRVIQSVTVTVAPPCQFICGNVGISGRVTGP